MIERQVPQSAALPGNYIKKDSLHVIGKKFGNDMKAALDEYMSSPKSRESFQIYSKKVGEISENFSEGIRGITSIRDDSRGDYSLQGRQIPGATDIARRIRG